MEPTPSVLMQLWQLKSFNIFPNNKNEKFQINKKSILTFMLKFDYIIDFESKSFYFYRSLKFIPEATDEK